MKLGNTMKHTRISLVLVTLLGACRVGPEHAVPDMTLPASWSEASISGPGSPETRWWSAFHDAELDTLVERAIAKNLDLEIARERVREARAVRAATTGQWEPQLDASGGYSRGRASKNTPQGRGTDGASDNFSAGFDASWEIDLFGRRDRAVEAADANVDAAIEGRRDALVTLLGDVARNYVELRGVQRQIALTKSNLATQTDTADLTRVRFNAGLSTDLDVARAEAQAATTRSAIPMLEAQARANIHALGVLLGDAPAALAKELEVVVALPEPPATIATGLPSELLRRRPDIRRAERELARATALTGAATADLFPRLSLGASIGQQAQRFSDMFDASSTAWSVGGSLFAPLLNGGTLRANVDAADARQRQAVLAYQKTVLQSLAEVENALSAVARERERLESLRAAVEADRRAIALSDDLYKRGLASFFEVLDAQRALFQTESTLATSATQLAAQTVALYKSLGGGWEVGEEKVAQSEPAHRSE